MILIDVRMPTNCDDGWRCGVTHSLFTRESYKGRLDNCPLIDLDKIIEEKKEKNS